MAENTRPQEKQKDVVDEWNVSTAPQPKPVALLAKKHTGMMVDYTGLIGQSANALVAGEREPAMAGMLRQLQDHLTQLGQRWYAGDTAVVDEFLQLYCIEGGARRRIEGEIK